MIEIVEKTVYSYSPQTGEYAGETTAMRSPLDVDEVCLIPAWATEAAPPETGERQAAVFRADDGSVPSHSLHGGCWRIVPDWRGAPLWSKANAQPVAARIGDTLDSLGATELEPPAFGVWAGKGWVVDSAALFDAQVASVEAEQSARRAQADAAIVPLHDAVELGVATDSEVEKLKVWRRYRIELSRVAQQSGYPQSVEWPGVPTAIENK
ncbi:hypothetical protein B0T40_09855 [Chromobacterium haemolyticum]|uniref:tail fiber assembly protein n=1 Tax=Chromobacterium haemolyticum TaxID=394935 RepID=UPI0009DB280E|nr:tail fiber assembly protein [Chromobacterium haemolyticum]OQS36687.1 hypothetical protein B0T40_09855 [Chromobacterium haemolyticum]